MRNDQIFVLLLVILLPMSGCFDGAVGDAEGTDDATDDGSVTEGDGTSTGSATSNQARTWYSSGGVYQQYWDDGQYAGYHYISNGTVVDGSENESYYQYWDNTYRYQGIGNQGQRCLSYWNATESVTGSVECSEWGYPESASDWNLTDCTDNGGEIIWPYTDEVMDQYFSYYSYAPSCMMTFATINSTIGEALMIYEWSGFSISSTCDGVNVYTGASALSGKEYVIAPGTALQCSHELYQTLQYTSDEDRFEDQSIWSIVYAIQDTTVV